MTARDKQARLPLRSSIITNPPCAVWMYGPFALEKWPLLPGGLSGVYSKRGGAVGAGWGARVDRYTGLVPRIVPNALPFSLAHQWALPLPRAHERLVFVSEWGRRGIHRERRRAAEPPDAAPVREQVRRKQRPLRWARHSSCGAARNMHTTSPCEQTPPRFPAGFRTIACIHTPPSRTLPPFRATPDPRALKHSRLALLSRLRADAQV